MNARAILRSALVAVMLAGAATAWAGGGRGHGGGWHGGAHYGGGWHGNVGVYLGAPLFSPYYYSPWPYYGYSGYYGPGAWYPPAVVGVPTTPPVYIERAPQAAAPAAQQYWYWCADPQGYYPTVRECRQPWTPVLPQPDARQ